MAMATSAEGYQVRPVAHLAAIALVLILATAGSSWCCPNRRVPSLMVP